MEKETYISKLNILIDDIKKRYNADIRFVEILKKRISFIAGDTKNLPVTKFKTIKLNDNLGFVVEESLSSEVINKVTTEIKKKLIIN